VAVNIFTSIGTTIDSATASFVVNGVDAIISAITGVATAGIALYFTCMGLMMAAGRVEQPLNEFGVKVFKIGFIMSIALSAGNLHGWLIGGLDGMKDGLSSALISASSTGPLTPSATPSTIYGVLDKALDDGLTLGSKCSDKASELSWYELGSVIIWNVASWIISAASIIVVLAGGITIIMTMFLLKILFVFSPLFVMSLAWPPTKQFFDKWFGQAMTYVMTIVVVSSVIALAILIFTNILAGTGLFDADGKPAENPLTACVLIILAAILLSAITKQVGGMAAALGGGMAASVISAGQALSGSVGAIKSAYNKLNPTSQKQNVDKDGKLSGPPVSSSRLGHMLMGRNAGVSPAFRRAAINRMKQNFGRNWSKTGGDAKAA